MYKSEDLQAFNEHEYKNAQNSLPKGLFAKLLKISLIQQKFSNDKMPIWTVLVTARNTSAHERVVRTYMKIIEKWGSGIPRMYNECSKYGLREPELVDMDEDSRVNFYRSSVPLKVTDRFKEREISAVRLIKNNPRITTTMSILLIHSSLKFYVSIFGK